MSLEKFLLSLLILFSGMALAEPDITLGDNTSAHPLLKYTPGPLPSILRTMVKDPHGLLRIGTDGVLRSFAANASVLDYRHLSSAQTHGLAPDGRGVLSEAAILHSPVAPSRGGPQRLMRAGRSAWVSLRPGAPIPPQLKSSTPEILGECAPPGCVLEQHDLRRVDAHVRVWRVFKTGSEAG
ncbi:hypothetical protein NW754_005391 [Fusarium falciforme]|nr:hypothetical protein NW754_005391 [Fusarium falciforme]